MYRGGNARGEALYRAAAHRAILALSNVIGCLLLFCLSVLLLPPLLQRLYPFSFLFSSLSLSPSLSLSLHPAVFCDCFFFVDTRFFTLLFSYAATKYTQRRVRSRCAMNRGALISAFFLFHGKSGRFEFEIMNNVYSESQLHVVRVSMGAFR